MVDQCELEIINIVFFKVLLKYLLRMMIRLKNNKPRVLLMEFLFYAISLGQIFIVYTSEYHGLADISLSDN